MIDTGLPIQRLRLELDRTLRSRAFFARAVEGRLSPAEYADLLVQLSSLIDALDGPHATDLVELGREDARDVVAGGAPCAPCHVVSLVGCAARRRRAFTRETSDLSLAVLGTSWTADAAVALSSPFCGSTRLLSALSIRAQDGTARLLDSLTSNVTEVQPLYACAELMRGALLGLATYLDAAWPTRSHVVDLHLDPELANPGPHAHLIA